MRGILYYDTKYGSTENICRWIVSEITYAPVKMEKMHGKTDIDVDCDFYIIGCPIYIGRPRDGVIQFIMNHKDHMQNKVIFFFITSWAQATEFRKECERFTDLMQHYLEPARAVLWVSLPGKLVLDQLTDKERCALSRLLGKIDKLSEEFQSKKILFMDKTNEKESRDFGKKINLWLQLSGNMF